MANDNPALDPQVKAELKKLKLKVANETLGQDRNAPVTADNYEAALDQKKWEAAEELGMKDKIENGGWKNMTTGDVGKIGGRVGGQIGGQMVKELISKAESQMAPVADEALDKEAVTASMRDE